MKEYRYLFVEATRLLINMRRTSDEARASSYLGDSFCPTLEKHKEGKEAK